MEMSSSYEGWTPFQIFFVMKEHFNMILLGSSLEHFSVHMLYAHVETGHKGQEAQLQTRS